MIYNKAILISLGFVLERPPTMSIWVQRNCYRLKISVVITNAIVINLFKFIMHVIYQTFFTQVNLGAFIRSVINM